MDDVIPLVPTSQLEPILLVTYNVRMQKLRFEWNPTKAISNAKKHGISFDEARTAFYDENAMVFADPDHSDEEARFLLLGNSVSLRTLVVCHCFRENESVIRLISARKADKDETNAYWRRGK